MKPKIEIPSCESCPSRKDSVFCNLFGNDLHELSANKGCQHFSKGQTIFFEGSRPTGVYCIYSGKVKIFKNRGNGKLQVVRLAKKGDILGYRSLLSGEEYSASAKVLEDTLVCYVPKQYLLQLLKSNSDFSLKMMELFAHELQSAEEKITSMATKPVRERLAETLLLLKDFYGLKSDKQTLDVNLTRDDLASIAGTSMETVVRLLSDFKDEKVLALNNKQIKVLDSKKLFQIAHLYD